MSTKRRPHGPQEYLGNGNHAWEYVADATYRLRVPGGWLYRDDTLPGIAFVPVPNAVGYVI